MGRESCDWLVLSVETGDETPAALRELVRRDTVRAH